MAMGYQEGKDEVADNKRKSRESWRKYGAERRKELVAKDETLGGTRFEMHKKCSVEKYFRIAEKAISDFRLKCEDVDMNVEEIYVMGHRLKAFLGHALPQHPHYMRQQVAKLRSKSLQNLTWIKDKMHELAIKIDEEQLDSFVTLDFEPEPDDVSTSSSEPDFDFNKFEDESASFADFSSMGGSVEDQEWHSFTGWGPLEFPSDKDLPPTIETDSSSSQGPDGVSSWDGSEAEEETPFDFRTNTSDLTSDNEEEPQAVVTFQDEEEEDDDDDDDDTNNVSASHTTTTTTTLHSSSSPLPNISMSKRHKPEYIPPAGFSIAARVYIDPTDKLAHLDEDHHPAVVTLPYFDCGVTGSTTAPLPVRDATFRHSLTATTPFQGTDGKHPLLAIALTDLSIETNSGDRQDIRAGQAILLEDVLAAGHKLLPMAHQELQVLFLTLPQTHYHPGKDRLSLHKQSSSKSTLHPCPLPDGDGTTHPLLSSRRRPTDLRHIRRAVLGALGLSLSALMADFLAKTAPLWLAVGVGGTCFVAAGTAAVVLGGEALWANLEYALEQRRLQSTTTTTTTTSKKRQKNNASPSEMPQES
mmetsp:Transcript_7620/g.15635  ORF Transcript_7620/g.15635 Transcript_7620/m.15635 type:complete len:584 (+) Transcript_7620:145-1896(+)